MEQLTPLLESLAEKLGTTTEYLWAILVRQQYIFGSVKIGVAIFLCIVSIITLFFIPRILKKLDWDGGYDWSQGQFWTTLYILFNVIFIGTAIGLTISGLMNLQNAEYYALQEILGVLGK